MFIFSITHAKPKAQNWHKWTSYQAFQINFLNVWFGKKFETNNKLIKYTGTCIYFNLSPRKFFPIKFLALYFSTQNSMFFGLFHLFIFLYLTKTIYYDLKTTLHKYIIQINIKININIACIFFRSSVIHV